MSTKWGIASAGLISFDFVLSIAETLPKSEHEIVAVAARDGQRAKKFAKDFNIPQSYGSYEELAADPNVEIVYIGTINTEHVRLSKLYLDHGKHVLCEKPLTTSKADTVELVQYAKEKNLFFMEGVWSRFFPAYQKIKEIIQSGDIGEVLNIHVTFGVQIDKVPRVSQKALGGSAVLDIGVYAIQFALFILGKPDVIKASGHVNEDDVDDAMSTVFLYSGGRLATLNIDTRIKLPNEARVTGTNGTIVVKEPFHCPTHFTVNGKLHAFPLPEVSRDFVFPNSCGLRYEAIEVRRCLEAGLKESPVVDHDLTLLIADIQEELRRQIKGD